MYEEDSFMKEDSSMDEEDPMMALEKMEEDSSQDFSKGDC